MKTIGAVGYLNALPLIHGMENDPGIRLIRHVPSALLQPLESGLIDVALCPVIDFQRCTHELVIVPSGAIGSRARTLTVRVFSRRPLEEVSSVAVDGDSHTSVALMQIIFSRLFDRMPALVPLTQAQPVAQNAAIEAALLIGDKVVTREPSARDFPVQLDLGQAWRDLTGQPFVFATWMAHVGNDLGELPQILRVTRDRNMGNLEGLTPGWAKAHAWPAELALTYLRDLLDFEAGAAQLRSMELFWSECAALSLIDGERPPRLYAPPG